MDNKSKASEVSGDRGSIMSKIIGLESNTNVDFEHVHTKITNDNEDTIIKKGSSIVLECDKKVKE